MDDSQGWVKLHRAILEWEWYRDTNTKSLFLHLLVKANHREKKFQGNTIKRGQLVTGLYVLSDELSLSVQQLRTSLKKLKSTNEITIESTNKNSVITIVNYDLYQVKEEYQQADQQTSNKQITNEQQTDNKPSTTNKNDKNIKNEIMKEYIVCDSVEKISTSPTQNFSSPSFGKQPIENLKKNCAGHTSWLETIGMKNSLLMPDVLEWFDAFCLHLLSIGKTEETEQEFKKYCSSWISSEIRQGRKPKVENQNKDAPKKTALEIAQQVIIDKHGKRAYEG